MMETQKPNISDKRLKILGPKDETLNKPSPSQLSTSTQEEIRKERKRQSNRESARRSRMRKKLEYEELIIRVSTQRNEIPFLKAKLTILSEELVNLSIENDSIQEELVEMYGPESIADLLPIKPESVSVEAKRAVKVATAAAALIELGNALP